MGRWSMSKIDWEFVRRALKTRRFARTMNRKGYRKHETDWEINYGGKSDHIIVDAVIDINGKHVWTKIEKAQNLPNRTP